MTLEESRRPPRSAGLVCDCVSVAVLQLAVAHDLLKSLGRYMHACRLCANYAWLRILVAHPLSQVRGEAGDFRRAARRSKLGQSAARRVPESMLVWAALRAFPRLVAVEV